MNPDDELNFGLIDDPTPPDPDAARLQKAIARGRQRLIRRRAIFGAFVGSVALVLIGSGVAVAQHDDAAPQVQVQPTTTTIVQTAATAREADMNGLHYTLRLVAPVVAAGAPVTVTVYLENRTKVGSVRSACTFGVNVVDPSSHSLRILVANCPRPGVPIPAGGSLDEVASTFAPTQPGKYAVVVNPESGDALPAALVRDAFDLEVVPASATTTSTQPGSSSELLGPTPTDHVRPGVTAPGAPDPNPGINDFVGTLTARKSTTTVGQGVEVLLTVRNNTAHTIEGARGSLPNSLGLVCTNDLTPDGHTNRELRSEENFFFVTIPPLAPGDSGGRSGSFVPTSDDIGTVTCEAVLLQTSAQWQAGTVTSFGRLSNIGPVMFTVTAASDTSTTSTTPNESSTTPSTSAVQP